MRDGLAAENAVGGQQDASPSEVYEQYVGGPGLLRMLAVETTAPLRQAAETAAANAQSATYLVEGDRVLAVFEIADAIRPAQRRRLRRRHPFLRRS